jgi:hypothetical protein
MKHSMLVLTGLVALQSFAQTGATALSDLARVRPGRARRVSSASPDALSNRDNLRVAAGETRVLADIQGPATIDHIWLTFSEARPNWISAEGSANPSEMVLRMYWDDAEQPAVEAPLGDFFAAGFGLRAEVKSLPVQVEGGDSYNCYWPMPFFKRGRITLTNESEKRVNSFYFQIDYTEEESLPPDTAYFCAQYRQEFPEQPGRDYLIADIAGRGHYVGTVFSARSRSPEWFGEGDDKWYIDGEERPSRWGTGTEDFISCAWGLSKSAFPYFGVSCLEGDVGDVGAQMCAYRWNIADPVRFTKSLRLEIEHWGWMSADETETGKVEGFVEREDDLATVAFWYQIGQPKRFTTLPSAKERVFPSLDLIIEGQKLLKTARHSGGELKLQEGYDRTGAGQLFWIPAADQPPTPFLEFDFQVEKEELRRLVLRLTHSYDYGQYRVLLDEKVAAERVELYSPETEVHDLHLGDHTLTPGKHTLRLECVGKNAASTGIRLGVDSVRLRRRWLKQRPVPKPAPPATQPAP